MSLLSKQGLNQGQLEECLMKSRIGEVLEHEREYQRRKVALVPTIIVDDEEEDVDMNVPIKRVMKCMKSLGHRPRQAKVRKLNT
ncbi:hypothetical protein Dimus_013321 [Dionaea muscipula]